LAPESLLSLGQRHIFIVFFYAHEKTSATRAAFLPQRPAASATTRAAFLPQRPAASATKPRNLITFEELCEGKQLFGGMFLVLEKFYEAPSN
jgi:hypothetical protein